MNRISGRLVLASLSILFVASLVLLGLQTARLRKLEDREDTWAEYKTRLDARAAAAEKQSLFFLEKLAEVGFPERAAGLNGPERAREEAYRFETIASRLEEVSRRLGEIEERLASAESSDDEEAAFGKLVTKRLDELSASTAAATSEISSLRAELGTAVAARERVEARLSDMARKLEEENGTSPIDEVETLEDLVSGLSAALEKQSEELALLRKETEEAASSRERLAAALAEMREREETPEEIAGSSPGEGSKSAASDASAGPAGPGTGEPRPSAPAGDAAAAGSQGKPGEATPAEEKPAKEAVRELPVIFVDGARGRVVLGGGEDEGISNGQIFDIRRAGRRIGQIRIYGTGEDMAAGTIINLVPGESVKKEDTALVVASPSTPSGDTGRLELPDVPPPPGTDEGS